VEVRCALPVERARRCPTILSGAETLETLRHDGRVLAMVVGMHLNIRGTNVDLVTARLKMIFLLVGLFLKVNCYLL